uniref:Secreted protein n=1 Tax=Lepeophtheirus salmonis TaxID=72036 RepID=A0A0K2TKE4_LEPSM
MFANCSLILGLSSCTFLCDVFPSWLSKTLHTQKSRGLRSGLERGQKVWSRKSAKCSLQKFSVFKAVCLGHRLGSTHSFQDS